MHILPLRLFTKVPFQKMDGAFFYLRLSQFLQLFTCINVILFMSVIAKESRGLCGEIDEREERVSSWGCQ